MYRICHRTLKIIKYGNLVLLIFIVIVLCLFEGKCFYARGFLTPMNQMRPVAKFVSITTNVKRSSALGSRSLPVPEITRHASNHDDDSNDEKPIIIPIELASSRRAPKHRITNKYSLIESNDDRLPEKLNGKRRRETRRFMKRQNEQVKKINNAIQSGSRREFSFRTIAEVEEFANGRFNGGNVDVSEGIYNIAQSARNKKALQSITDELIACVTSSAEGDRISLSSIIVPRHQTSLIRLLGAKGAYKTMLDLLHHFEKSMNVAGAQYAYTAAITALAQTPNKKWRDHAMSLLDEMDQKQIPPNTYTFTAAFLAVDGKDALDLLNRAKASKSKFVEVGIHLYNGAIHACSRNDSSGKNGWQIALSLLRTQMPKDGIEPNEQTYTSIIHACAKSGQLKVALSIFNELRSTKGISSTSANKVWGAILRACATTGDSSTAMNLMKEMFNSEVIPNTLHYNSVLSAIAKEGNDRVAVMLLERMASGTVRDYFLDDAACQALESKSLIQAGSMPDQVSINTVLSSFVKSENYMGAKQFFQRVKLGEFMYDKLDSRAVIRPDIISYNTLLSVCNQAREAKIIMQEVCLYFNCAMSYIFFTATHNVQIRSSRRNRMNILKPTSVTYTNAIGACKRSNPPDMDTAMYFFEEAKKDGIKQNV